MVAFNKGGQIWKNHPFPGVQSRLPQEFEAVGRLLQPLNQRNIDVVPARGGRLAVPAGQEESARGHRG